LCSIALCSIVQGSIVLGPVVQARTVVPLLRVRGAAPGGVTAEYRLRAAAGRRRERLRLIGGTCVTRRLVSRPRMGRPLIRRPLIRRQGGVADLRDLVSGQAAGRARRPVAGPAEVPLRTGVAGSVIGPVISRENRVAVRGLRAL